MRNLLLFASLLGACACTSSPEYSPWTEPLADYFDAAKAPFYHGVASGDPLPDGVILWTRVTPKDSLPEIEVAWEVSESTSFDDVVQAGTTTTHPGRDYTVKVDARGLEPGTRYYYRFEALGSTSNYGATKTAPLQADSLKFAVVSCSNYEFGYFNAYAALANRTDLHAVVHLGDYIYEYGMGVYGDSTTGRFNMPPHEIISLADYRMRYAQYRLDPDLAAAHAQHPFINIWDDHEIANNAYVSGAQNHSPEEGEYTERKSVAVQAYYEWIPIREGKQHYRAFAYGNLADLIMLDERLAGRTAPADSLTDPSLDDSTRSMLGAEQMAWLMQQLTRSDATWKVIGNQVIFSYLNWGFDPSFTINLDSWDGYPQEQAALANFIRTEAIENVVFVTGDTHSSWAFEVTENPFSGYNPATAEGAIAVEFGATSINSGNSNDRAGATDSLVMAHEARISNSSVNPHLKYANLRDHGYLLLTLTEEQAQAAWYYVPTLRERSGVAELGKSLYVNSGEVKLQPTE